MRELAGRPLTVGPVTRRLQAGARAVLEWRAGAARWLSAWCHGVERGRAGIFGLLALLVLAAAGAAGAYVWLKQGFDAPGPAAQVSRIEVSPGTSVRAVLNHLEAAGTVRNARAVEWYMRLTRPARAR